MADYPRIPIVSMQVGQYPYVLIYLYRRLFLRRRTFVHNGSEVEYFEHPYNRTWLNERSIEIPLVWKIMQQYAPGDVLEIGNVISHYFRFGHVVVDKYEKRRGVLQRDVVGLTLSQKYRLIVTISTLEHVGWDESPRTPGKHLAALASLTGLLAPGGLLVATLPIGYNPALDDDLFAGRLGFNEVHFFKRISRETWKQADADEVKGSEYGVPFGAANAVAIGFTHSPEGS